MEKWNLNESVSICVEEEGRWKKEMVRCTFSASPKAYEEASNNNKKHKVLMSNLRQLKERSLSASSRKREDT